MFPFGEPPAVTHSSTSPRLPSVRGKKGLGVRSKKELSVRSWKDSDVRGSTSSGMWQAMWKCAILPHAKYMWGRLSENSSYTIILSSRRRGISRHVPVDLVRWLDFARHDRMIAADRFSDSLRGGNGLLDGFGHCYRRFRLQHVFFFLLIPPIRCGRDVSIFVGVAHA